MTMNVGDIIRIKTTTEVLGVPTLNVYHVKIEEFFDTGFTNEAFLAVQFHKQVAAQFVGLCTIGAILKSTYVENLSDVGRPFATYSENIAGTQTGETLPTFVAFAYRQNVSNRVTRNGYKRYAGGSEAFCQSNDWSSTFVSSATALSIYLGGSAVVIEDSIETGSPALSYSNIILKSVHSDPPAITDWQRVTSASFINSPTSQTTRKRL